MTTKFRIEGNQADIQQALDGLRRCGANVTGVTQLYINRTGSGFRLYCLATFLPDGDTPAVDRVTLARIARAKGDALKLAGDGYHASYYYGMADGLET